MICPVCAGEVVMEALGFGDHSCPECGHVEYSEKDKDFYDRINRINEQQKDQH